MLKFLILGADRCQGCADRKSGLFDLGAPTADANTIRLFRERLTEAGAPEEVFTDFNGQLKECRYLALGGHLVDVTFVAAPKQRNCRSAGGDSGRHDS